ncbi:MAG: hypothetical protein FJ291_29090 [Planctomycetes bacterium]|nr:hypothetical protein [Planctomycetota bacterium]
MPKQPGECPEFKCPFYDILDRLCPEVKGASEFVGHLKKAKVELLLALRSLIDHRVESLTAEGKPKGRAQRIKVTEQE